MRFLIISCFLLSLLAGGSVFAGEKQKSRKPQSEGEIHVIPLDRDLPPDSFADAPNGVAVHGEADQNGKLLPPSVQEQILEKSGVQALVKDWDAFETDLFLLRVEARTAEEVVARYNGKFSVMQIREMKVLIANARKR